MDSSRITALNAKEVVTGEYVVYWMQSSQRTIFNHALERSIEWANILGQNLVVFFGIDPHYPEANLRHYNFMIQGLTQVDKNLKNRNIALFTFVGNPSEEILNLQPSVLIVDRGYMKHEILWRKKVADNVSCKMEMVETNALVPIELVSSKKEYSAATLRKKLWKAFNQVELKFEQIDYKGDYVLSKKLKNVSLSTIKLDTLGIDYSVKPVLNFIGGEEEAIKKLEGFVRTKLPSYGADRNSPALEVSSKLSPYLHFGQISPLYIYIRIMKEEYFDNASSESRNLFLEELIVRRELAFNYVYYNSNYDSIEGIPSWCKDTLEKHKLDERPYLYSLKTLELGQTHDEYWNSCQREMVITGKMHNYMRMYWGKKVIEWSSSPKEAYDILIYLNNKYELDGRDPNGYAGIAWCFGTHDRPWKERKIFGNIRYMAKSGLDKKFPMEDYVRKTKLKEY